VKKWRDANLSFEQAKVELNVRGCESQRKGIVDQLDNATRVLAKIKPAVTDIQGQMDSLRKDSARWVGSLTQLDDKLHAAGELLSECRHQFHLADLAFATRVLLQTCDEMAANSFEDVSPYNIDLWDIVPEELPNVKFDSLEPIKSRPVNSQMMQTRLPTMKASDKRPANIAENMARLDLATAKLKYLAELLEADAKSLGSAVERLEKIGKEATKIEGKVAELFQNLASLGQALDRHRTDIAVGLGRLLLVQKRLESEDSALRASVAEATRQIAEFNRLLGK
jgi:chromosome segregation ATPase